MPADVKNSSAFPTGPHAVGITKLEWVTSIILATILVDTVGPSNTPAEDTAALARARVIAHQVLTPA